MERIALFPGTFDPITLGHVDIITRAVGLFDKIVIGIGSNSAKQPMFPMDQRIAWMKKIFKDQPSISVVEYKGLTIQYAEEIGAKFILRGIRSVGDFEYEKAIADMNSVLNGNVETIFLACAAKYSTVSSTLVRDVLRHGGDVSAFVPEEVGDELRAKNA